MPEVTMLDLGFFTDPGPWKRTPQPEEDKRAFLSYIFAHTGAEMKVLCDRYPIIKKKFQIINEDFKTQVNIDLEKL